MLVGNLFLRRLPKCQFRLAEIFGKTHQAKEIVRYQAFKTATVSLSKDQIVDFATARKEVYIRPGAFPTVTPSTIQDDLYRRDFTINAIAISINPETWGKLVDPYDGKADLKAKKIRVLHPKSFEDDQTRILRAARFKARLGFTIEKRTLQILEKSVLGGALETIKKQRYRKDLEKILKEQKSKDAIQCLKSWNAYKEEK